MKVILRFVDLFLYTSVFTSFCAVALCIATEKLIDSSAPLFGPFHLFVFGSSLVVYNAPRFVPRPYGRKQKPRIHVAWYYLAFVIGVALTIAGMAHLPFNIIMLSAFLSLFAFGYFLPLLPFKNKKRLRDIGWLKIAVLAGVWTISTAVLPIMYLHKDAGDYPFEIILRFVFIFALCVVFDIRDVRSDLQNHIHTLPNKVGVRNSYRLINISLILFALLSVAQYLHYPSNQRVAGALLTTIITWFIVRYIRRQPSDRAYLLLADGAMALYALLVVWI